MAFYFPLIHVAVGAGITYYVLCGWLNRTRITAGCSKVSVRHGPLPWFGNLEMDSSAIKQLYAKEVISRSRNGATVRYDLNALTRDGRSIKFISGIENSDQALYIEQEIEKFLGIKIAQSRESTSVSRSFETNFEDIRLAQPTGNVKSHCITVANLQQWDRLRAAGVG